MQLHRTLRSSLCLLLLPLFAACGEADDGTMETTPTATTTTAVTPPPPAATTTGTTPPAPPPATDLYSAVHPIFQAKCAGGACHSTVVPPLVIGDEATAKANAAAAKDKIVARVLTAKTMPPAGSPALDAAELAAVQAWVDSL